MVTKTLEGKREKDKYEEEKRERVSFLFKEREGERWVKRDIEREKKCKNKSRESILEREKSENAMIDIKSLKREREKEI